MALTSTHADRAPRIPEWTLGERLAKARKDAGLEQEHMARIFKVSTSAISNWENDISQPRKMLAVIATWAAETGVPQGWLLGTLDQGGSRWSSRGDLRVIPGGRKDHELPGQARFSFLSLIEP